MPTIKPVSDLRNYNDVLRDVAMGAPVFLTKNGRGKYVLLDIKDYERIQAALAQKSQPAEGEKQEQESDILKQLKDFEGV